MEAPCEMPSQGDDETDLAVELSNQCLNVLIAT
jgi:hypothetical protein